VYHSSLACGVNGKCQILRVTFSFLYIVTDIGMTFVATDRTELKPKKIDETENFFIDAVLIMIRYQYASLVLFKFLFGFVLFNCACTGVLGKCVPLLYSCASCYAYNHV